MKKVNSKLLIVLSIICSVMLMISCGEPKEEWTDVSSMEGLDGTWTGKYVVDTSEISDEVPESVSNGMDPIQLDCEMTLKYPFEEDEQIFVKQEVVISYEKYLNELEKQTEGIFTAEKFWNLIKNSFAEVFEVSEGYPYTLTMTVYTLKPEFVENLKNGTIQIQINQDKSKIKYISKDGDEISEVILYKN